MQKIRKLKEKKGITLIALIITIIVLLILAGISINLIMGDNSVIKKSKTAGMKTDRAEIIEESKTEIAGYQTENLDNRISKSQLKEVLDKYFKEVPDIVEWNEDLKEMKLNTKEEYGVYEIAVSEIYNGEFIEDGVGAIGGLKPDESIEPDETIEFTNDSGKIDIVWLNTNNNIIEKPNVPIITAGNDSMTPQTWSEEEQKFVDADVNSNWYSYTGGEGDHKSSKWANAKTANESYFVWIPRYAYRITYYKDGVEEPVGYYDGYGLWMAGTGKVKYEIDEGIETVKGKDGNLYIVHPAFIKDTNKTAKDGIALSDYDRGGWSENLAGFWIAKYEMSGETGATLKSTFGVSSIRSQTTGTQYISARQATYGYNGQEGADGNTSFMNSHMIKNSEWGAVAYLTHSVYGRNRNEITVNSNSSYYTGGGSGLEYIANSVQSTTGNIYGVYDMSGGAWESTSAYTNTENSSKYVTKNGWTGLTPETPSSRYATRYYNETGNSSGSSIYEVGKTGDATKETYLGTGICSWYDDYAYFAYASTPFFARGGYYRLGMNAGMFYSVGMYGSSDRYYSFRTVLCARLSIEGNVKILCNLKSIGKGPPYDKIKIS